MHSRNNSTNRHSSANTSRSFSSSTSSTSPYLTSSNAESSSVELTVQGQMFYSQKVIISGNVIEHYSYQYPISARKRVIPRITGRKRKSDQKGTNSNYRHKTGVKARKEVERLIHANLGAWTGKCLFVTLTFANPVTELSDANNAFKLYLQRLTYLLFATKSAVLKYLAVPEFHAGQDGGIHYHVVFFNLPSRSRKKIKEVWGQGNVHLETIKSVDGLIRYLVKGMKNPDPRFAGKKSYFCSRNLNKPYKVTDSMIIGQLLESLPIESLITENTFKNDYLGRVDVKKYRMPAESGLNANNPKRY